MQSASVQNPVSPSRDTLNYTVATHSSGVGELFADGPMKVRHIIAYLFSTLT